MRIVQRPQATPALRRSDPKANARRDSEVGDQCLLQQPPGTANDRSALIIDSDCLCTRFQLYFGFHGADLCLLHILGSPFRRRMR